MAYAAITSLGSTIQQSMQLTGFKLQSFYEKLESLIAITEKPCIMIGNLGALTRLEAEVIELACSTEDMVDSESRNVMVDPESRNVINIISRKIAFWRLCFLLKQAIRHIDSTAKKWIGTQTSQDLKAQNPILPSTSERALEPENMMVGHENEFEMMQVQLARGASELEVVSIVGMGGIGKTTLANKIFSDPFIMSHFDIRAKVTISQEYCLRKGLLGLLSSITGNTDKPYEQQDDGQLKDQLQKLLKGRRYLIVIDDIWDDIKLCFPDCNNRSRILLTTRNVEVAEYASSDAFAPFQLPHPNAFPQNLKSLAFSGTFFCWNDLSIFGKLPKLESLKLGYDAFQDKEWEIVDEVFPRLKFLLLEDLEIRHWRASCDNFPCLERLFLKGCWYLDSIPQDFADITTLALIDIRRCAKTVDNSAKQIQQDIQDNYAISIEVHIH